MELDEFKQWMQENLHDADNDEPRDFMSRLGLDVLALQKLCAEQDAKDRTQMAMLSATRAAWGHAVRLGPAAVRAGPHDPVGHGAPGEGGLMDRANLDELLPTVATAAIEDAATAAAALMRLRQAPAGRADGGPAEPGDGLPARRQPGRALGGGDLGDGDADVRRRGHGTGRGRHAGGGRVTSAKFRARRFRAEQLRAARMAAVVATHADDVRDGRLRAEAARHAGRAVVVYRKPRPR
jgi:hypothetical protein